MKRLLIISPYFPPVNAADMQRMRMSLPYFAEFGWQADVVTVHPKFVDMPVDVLLTEALPSAVTIHYVNALNKKVTSKFRLGSLALRSLWSYRAYVDKLLRQQKFDLIYFSTTQFPICILGAYWKRRWQVHYVIDMQDPWHTEYYRNKPKAERPSKYWFSYRLNKWLEPKAMRDVDGLVSVSDTYINDLQARYPETKNIPVATITFGAFAPDMDIARKHSGEFKPLLSANHKNIVYVGRGGNDMHIAIAKLFEGLKLGLKTNKALFENLRLYFIGTSYAPSGQGAPSIKPLAETMGVAHCVIEQTNRISYYHALATLDLADGLFVPGSDSPGYTASKIYPYLLSSKPLLAIFDNSSPALKVFDEYGVETAYKFDEATPAAVMDFLADVVSGKSAAIKYNQKAIEKYSAKKMTAAQCLLFDQVVNTKKQ